MHKYKCTYTTQGLSPLRMMFIWTQSQPTSQRFTGGSISSPWPNLGLQRLKKLCAQNWPFLEIPILSTDRVRRSSGRRRMLLRSLSCSLCLWNRSITKNKHSERSGFLRHMHSQFSYRALWKVIEPQTWRWRSKFGLKVWFHIVTEREKTWSKQMYNNSQCGWLSYFWIVKKLCSQIHSSVWFLKLYYSFSHFLQTKNINQRSPGFCDQISSLRQ